LKVLKLGDPRLHKRASAVNDFGSRSFCFNLESLKEALENYGGMGIAAPQLGIDQRVLLIHSRPNKRYPNAPHSQLLIMVNPEYISKSNDVECDWEGCLSVPDQRAKVFRSKSVKVRYQDITGAFFEMELNGFLGRIFQHEFDHIEGLLFIDHVEPTEIISEADYLKRYKSS
jgi:peptide deformylase